MVMLNIEELGLGTGTVVKEGEALSIVRRGRR